MITLQRGQSNTVALTLTEKCTLSNPYFLFVLENDTSKDSYYFIATDTSSYTDRYNRFTVTEKSSPDTLNGEVYLPLTGSYHYTVYEQSSNTNLDPANATGVVEIGRCKVKDATPANTEYTTTDTNKVYNG